MPIMTRRALLPALIGLVAVAELSTALVGASRLRADQRIARAVAAEHRAVAAYRTALLPVVLQVYDAVQPLQDLDDAFATPDPALADVRDDVLARSGAVAALASAGTRAKALVAPRSLRTEAKEVSYQLDGLGEAARTLAAATTARGDATGYVQAFSDGFIRLHSSETGWFSAMERVYGVDLTVPTPSTDRGTAHGRTAPTRGAFIQAADLTCAHGDAQAKGVAAPRSAAAYAQALGRLSAIDRRVGAALMRLALPPSDAGAQHELALLLTAERAFPAVLDAEAQALRAGTASGVVSAAHRVNALLPGLRDLSRAMDQLGARLCGHYYDVDALLRGPGKTTLTA